MIQITHSYFGGHGHQGGHMEATGLHPIGTTADYAGSMLQEKKNQ